MIQRRQLTAKITDFRVDVVDLGPEKPKLLGRFDCDWGFLKVRGCALLRSHLGNLFVVTPTIHSFKTQVRSVKFSKTALRHLKLDAFNAFQKMGGVE